jgi:outer membrane lipoprotein
MVVLLLIGLNGCSVMCHRRKLWYQLRNAVVPSAFSVLVLTIAACAGTPDFNLQTVDQAIEPRDVVAQPQSYQGKNVLWGGIIVNSSNVKDGTEVELLTYPLDGNYKPQTDKDTLGRIIAFNHGYLETLDYAEGRLLTVTGTVQGIKKAPVEEAIYTYPVVNASQLHLWPQQDSGGESRVHFGIGVILH